MRSIDAANLKSLCDIMDDKAPSPMWAQFKIMIDDVPTVDPVQWVLCSDRLPNSEEQVIVTCHDTGGDTAFNYTSCGWVTRNGEYWIVENEINPYVIAWTPFPKPYKVKHE